MSKALRDAVKGYEDEVRDLIEQITVTQVEISYAEHEDRKEDRRSLTRKLTALQQELYILRP